VPATVANLDALPRPALLPDNRRAAPVELTTYTVRAVFLEIRDEADHDLHLVIADPGDQHKTMIAEIVDPGCSGAIASRDVADLRRVRENFDRTYDPPPGQKYWPKPGDVMRLPASASSISSKARAALPQTRSNFTRCWTFGGSTIEWPGARLWGWISGAKMVFDFSCFLT
jgi:hypothetical protein